MYKNLDFSKFAQTDSQYVNGAYKKIRLNKLLICYENAIYFR